MILTTRQPAYFPSLHYFWHLAQSDVLILTDHFQFVKRSPATVSARLQTSQPALRLPVKHSTPKTPLFEKIFDPNSHWAKKHLHTIRHMFHHTPYAYYYMPVIEKLLYAPPPKLSDFLYATLLELVRLLHLDLRIFRSSQLEHNASNEALVTRWCRQTQCGIYAAESLIFAEGRVNEKQLLQNGIACERFSSFPDFHILQSNRDLSILYFLFQFGPEAGYMLRQYLPRKSGNEKLEFRTGK